MTSLAVVKLGFENTSDEIISKDSISVFLLHIVFFWRRFRENIDFLENVILKLQKDQIVPSATVRKFEFLILTGNSEGPHISNVFCRMLCMYIYHHSL